MVLKRNVYNVFHLGNIQILNKNWLVHKSLDAYWEHGQLPAIIMIT